MSSNELRDPGSSLVLMEKCDLYLFFNTKIIRMPGIFVNANGIGVFEEYHSSRKIPERCENSFE